MKVIKTEVLTKRFKNIEGKNEEQLNWIEDQEEKQSKVLNNKTKKEVDFKNVSFKNKLNLESKKSTMKLRNKVKRLIIQNLSALTQISISIISPSFWVQKVLLKIFITVIFH